jgi:hypothetical protein
VREVGIGQVGMGNQEYRFALDCLLRLQRQGEQARQEEDAAEQVRQRAHRQESEMVFEHYTDVPEHAHWSAQLNAAPCA